MSLIVGVGVAEPLEPLARLLKVLNFDLGPILLTHALEPIYIPAMGVATGPLIAPEMLAVAQREREASGSRALAHAGDVCSAAGLETQSVTEAGLAADVLMSVADARKARMIAVGSERRSWLESLLVGSVSRRLASAAHQSVLLARAVPDPLDKVNIVIATDHSAYADRAIEAFLAMKPSHVASVQLVTAIDTQIAAAGLTFGQGIVVDAIPDPTPEMTAKSEAQAARLREQLGCRVAVSVLHEPAIAAITAACKEGGADLLVMGAKGHGLLHRVLIGSVAMHFVSGAPCSVLLIRA